MNFKTAIVLAMFAVAGNAAELSVGSATLNTTAGQPAALNVTLASSGAALTGLQFDLEYDAAVLNVTIAAGSAAEGAGKNVQAAALQAGHQRIMIVGMNRTTIADGVVAVLQVSLKGQVAAGKTFAIRITAPAGTNAQAQAVAISGGSGSVQVENR